MAMRMAIPVALTLVVALAAPAAASPNSDAGDERARRAFVDGQRAYNLGHWAEAIRGFEESYKLCGDPVLLFNLAQAHRQAGHLREALTTYRAYLRSQPEAPNRSQVTARIAELEERVKSAAANPPAAPPPAAAAGDISDPFPAGRLTAGPPEKARAIPAWAPWVGAGVTVGLAVAAVIVTRNASDRFDELRRTCGPCPESEIDALKSKVVVRNLLWTVTGVSAALTGVGFYLSGREAGVAVAVRF